MSGSKYAAILFLALWAGPLPAQAGGGEPSVVVSSGRYQLTQAMLGQALRFGQILAAADFSPADAAALRADLIAYFQKEPAKQMAAYETMAKILQQESHPSWLDLALLRYRQSQSYGDPLRFREFRSYPFGRMVLKYNPVVVNSGAMVVTENDVDCLFYANTMVAKAAAVAPPMQADKDRFVRTLPSQFAVMPAEMKEDLRQAEIRLARFARVYDGTVKTHAAVLADIRKHVHSSADVWREARQVENDAGPAGIRAAARQAVEFQSRLAASQMRFNMQLDAARAARDAASALGSLSGGARAAGKAQDTAAAGKYWQSYLGEAGNASGADDGIVSLRGLIERNTQQ